MDDCFDDFDGMMHDLEEIMDRREQLLHILELAETEPVRSSLRELLGEEDDEGLEVESEADDGQEEDDEEDPDDEEFDKFEEELENAAFKEDSEPAPGKSDSLMDELRQALAIGDEERANELFEQIQNQ